MNNLDTRIEKSLRDVHDKLESRGELPSRDSLQANLAAFRSRFGPDALKSLDGPALLNAMHAHGNKDSLVYWLEFKNDDEFRGPQFGSISGGSAHKFGLFRRKETGQWVSGSNQNETSVSESDAVIIARRHRDQLLAGVELLEHLPAGAEDPAYVTLQGELQQKAPDISGLAWAHKYWCLLFPEKLDDYHIEPLQRHNLLRLLQMPPQGRGLYVCAGRFVWLASRMGWPINHLTSVLNERNGQAVHYWRLASRLLDGRSIWSAMRDGGYAAIGWEALGDLSTIAAGRQVKDGLKPLLEKKYPGNAKELSRQCNDIRDFIARVQERDVVLAADGERVLGIGRVLGPYRYETTEPKDAPHRHPVEWPSTEEWNFPTSETGRTVFFPADRNENDIVEIERRLLESHDVPHPAPSMVTAPTRALQLEGVPGRIQSILERKGQAIIYGPPGTGKTYWARQTARDVVSLGTFGRRFDDLTMDERTVVEGTTQKTGLVRWCTFHPAYGYEDFIEGFRPELNAANQLIFKRSTGMFKKLCNDASDAPERKFLLIVDEINRGDIPRIFGELLTLLESDKRGLVVSLPLSGECFAVPPNVYVIGTMNTADRSIALLDTALRRRFGFVELMPDPSVFGDAYAGDSIPLGPWLTALNERLRTHLGRDARNLQIGHAYLLDHDHPLADFAHFVRVLAEDIVPMLEEYCYENYEALARILGPGLVDEAKQRIREELFTPGKRPELVQALLEPAPEIMTASSATATPEEPDELAEADEPGT